MFEKTTCALEDLALYELQSRRKTHYLQCSESITYSLPPAHACVSGLSFHATCVQFLALCEWVSVAAGVVIIEAVAELKDGSTSSLEITVDIM